MAPRWTILLPTHDRAEVVGFAIRSVLAQTVEDFELLVVGDGCTDSTAEVVTGFDDDRIRWFDLPKAPGFGYANRNVALREARGEFVGFMAHDDLYFPDHLELMEGLLARPGVEWAYSRPLWIDDDGTIVPFAVDLRRPAELERFLNKGNRLPASCVVHRRDVLERVGGWPEERMQAGDWVLWTRMVGPAQGATIAYQPTPTCLHFRAIWKTGSKWGPVPLESWQRAANEGYWPDPLCTAVPPDTLPQADVWVRIEQGGDDWLEACRSAVVSVLDGFAWDVAVAQPRLERSLVDGGWALVRGDRYQEALALADAAMAVVPSSAPLATIRATAALGLGDGATALVAARRAIELDPRLVRAFRVLARALVHEGRRDEAIETLRAALEVGRDNAGWRTQLGTLLLDAGDIEGARAEAAAAHELAPNAPATRKLRERLEATRKS